MRKNSGAAPEPSAATMDCSSREERRFWNHSKELVSLQTHMNSTLFNRLGGLGPARRCHIFFSMLAQGVTPMPVPMSTAISFSNTSSAGAPYGPSMRIAGISCPFARAISYMPMGSSSSNSFCWVGPAPRASPSALVKSPTCRTWTEMYGSKGHDVIVKGCHCVVDTAGTLSSSHWPAL